MAIASFTAQPSTRFASGTGHCLTGRPLHHPRHNHQQGLLPAQDTASLDGHCIIHGTTINKVCFRHRTLPHWTAIASSTAQPSTKFASGTGHCLTGWTLHHPRHNHQQGLLLALDTASLDAHCIIHGTTINKVCFRHRTLPHWMAIASSTAQPSTRFASGTGHCLTGWPLHHPRHNHQQGLLPAQDTADQIFQPVVCFLRTYCKPFKQLQFYTSIFLSG